jgi:hypothetical protein
MKKRSRRVRFLSCLILLVPAAPTCLWAQFCEFGNNQLLPSTNCNGPPALGADNPYPRYFAINVALGAVTAGVSSRLHGGPFWRALPTGAFGGALVFVGKLTTSRQSPAAGIVGRELGAAGSSIVQNVSLNKPMLERFVFPLGPTRLYLRARDSTSARLKIDLAGTLATIYAATRPHSRMDFSASLRAGAPVFMMPRPSSGAVWEGMHLAGIIQVRFDPDLVRNYPSLQAQRTANAISHELVHVAQYDLSFIAWTEAGESALLRRIPGVRKVSGFVDISLNAPIWQALNQLLPNDNRPWEREAMAFTR